MTTFAGPVIAWRRDDGQDGPLFDPGGHGNSAAVLHDLHGWLGDLTALKKEAS